MLRVLAYSKKHCDILLDSMKQHIYQMILLVILVSIVGLVLKDESFDLLRKGRVEVDESAPSVGTTTTPEEPREVLFKNLKPLDIQYSTATDEYVGPRYIVSGGMVRSPDYFYSLPGTSTRINEVESLLSQASSSGAKVSYSTTTGTVTLVTNGFESKGREDVLDTVYVDGINKIAFKVDRLWKVTSKSGLISIQNVGFNGKNRILLTVTKNSVIKTADSYNGDFVLSYDLDTKNWISSRGSQDLVQTSPTTYTKNGDAIFDGTTRLITKIVSFGPSDYVIVNISGTDNPVVIHDFVASISKIQ